MLSKARTVYSLFLTHPPFAPLLYNRSPKVLEASPPNCHINAKFVTDCHSGNIWRGVKRPKHCSSIDNTAHARESLEKF